MGWARERAAEHLSLMDGRVRRQVAPSAVRRSLRAWAWLWLYTRAPAVFAAVVAPIVAAVAAIWRRDVCVVCIRVCVGVWCSAAKGRWNVERVGAGGTAGVRSASYRRPRVFWVAGFRRQGDEAARALGGKVIGIEARRRDRSLQGAS